MADIADLQFLLQENFCLTPDQLAAIAESFEQEMLRGLAGQPSSLAMLPSFLTRPSGQEQGTFLAIDFGGTNVRALLVELFGRGRFEVSTQLSRPLVAPGGFYNLIGARATAEDLFGFLARQVADIAPGCRNYPLGLTFSYPCRQTAADNSILISWTKEIQTSGVEGRDVGSLLSEALIRANLAHIRPAVVLNDTVSALLTAAYREPDADIGSICGTGHNTCYLEANPPQEPRPMYINMESGNYDKLPFNRYDIVLDQASDKLGAARLEKMSSGRYIGELLRLVALDASERGLVFRPGPPEFLRQQDSVTGADLALMLSDKSPDLAVIRDWLERKGVRASGAEDRGALRHIAFCVTRRSAQLVAATFAGLLSHIDPARVRRHVIAIDGSLYEKMPGYAGTIQETLTVLLGDFASRISLQLSKDGSGVGAAIAAATLQTGGR